MEHCTLITVRNVNSSLPREVPDQNAVRVEFNEALFDTSLVEVMFSSNCTTSTIVRYSNPAIIDIPSTGTNTGRCRYAILLVTRDNGSQQVGYPIEGTFEITGMYNYAVLFYIMYKKQIMIQRSFK
jgi:hypothetical protein